VFGNPDPVSYVTEKGTYSILKKYKKWRRRSLQYFPEVTGKEQLSISAQYVRSLRNLIW
jgi:hypothetical protein